MATISVSNARAEFSRLIERALAGEEIVITRRGKPAVRLVPVEAPPPRRKPGALKGLFEVTVAFFEPLPDDLLAAFYTGSIEPADDAARTEPGARAVTLLLDSHALLWWLIDDPRLSPRAGARSIERSSIFVSAASIWEIMIKAAKGKLKLPAGAEDRIRSEMSAGFMELARDLGAWFGVRVAGPHRPDPSIGLLITQARLEVLTIVTNDKALRQYEVDLPLVRPRPRTTVWGMTKRALAPLSECGAIVREHDPDRYLATLFAPAAAREALFALYAFDHEIGKVRHVVSEPMAGMIRLQWWRDALAGTRRAGPRTLVAQALHAALAARPPVRARLEAAIDARELELRRRRRRISRRSSSISQRPRRADHRWSRWSCSTRRRRCRRPARRADPRSGPDCAAVAGGPPPRSAPAAAGAELARHGIDPARWRRPARLRAGGRRAGARGLAPSSGGARPAPSRSRGPRCRAAARVRLLAPTFERLGARASTTCSPHAAAAPLAARAARRCSGAAAGRY